jgi:glycosyltransferase involved in cell wall biosynthesis
MKVLHLNTTDKSGGAAIAAQRLHSGLQEAGIASEMLVQQKTGDAPTIHGPIAAHEKVTAASRYPVARRLLKYVSGVETSNFSPAWFSKTIQNQIEALGPDIIHLHYTGREFLRPEQLQKIQKPLIWTIHDMWPFTGGCHYDDGCGRYRNRCGKCPVLKSSGEKDLSRRLWRRKKKAYEKLPLTIVTLSRWMQECVEDSTLLSGFPIERIPNGLNLQVFKPISRDMARFILGVPTEKKLILFGTVSAVSKANKGFQFLQPTLQTLSADLKNIELMVFGSSKPSDPPDFGFSTRYMGRLYDEVTLALLYSAADVFVAPSKQDNLPNTVMEALACGTPCVAFAIGGMKDLIDHQDNGYLVPPFDTQEMATGLKWVLEDRDRHEVLSQCAREKAVRCYGQELQAQRMIALYERILN